MTTKKALALAVRQQAAMVRAVGTWKTRTMPSKKLYRRDNRAWRDE